jgi:tRNA pseudouridine13 synthase
MKIKHKPQDFRVKELLVDGYVAERGRHRVYRVTKTKLTSFEAARALADFAGVEPSEVGLAGLKDRQGVTTQFMSVQGGKPVTWKSADLRIETAGFASDALTSDHSVGNAFEVTLRRVDDAARERMSKALEEVRGHGFVNYFGEQRFGNLRFGQGWIARLLALGEHEEALKQLLCGHSDADDARHLEFKKLLAARWGNWRACRDIAGKYGAHHSVFEQLGRDPEDFASALRRVAARLRLIHLYAWQSHLWNRAVSRYVAEITPARERMFVSSLEGELAFARTELASDPSMENQFRLPGVELTDVKHPRQKELFTAVLAAEGLTPRQYRIEGQSGFRLKGEDRELVVRPRRLRMNVDEEDGGRVLLRFELPRGSYATLLVARLAGRFTHEFRPDPDAQRAPRGERDAGLDSGRDAERDDGREDVRGPRRRNGAPRRGSRADEGREPRRERRAPAPERVPAPVAPVADSVGPERPPRVQRPKAKMRQGHGATKRPWKSRRPSPPRKERGA